MKIRHIIPILVLIVIFSLNLISCKNQTNENIEESVATETMEEEITDSAENNQVNDIQKRDYELFKEAIEDYDIGWKALEYSEEALNIMNDYIDIEKKELKMTKEEVGTRFMELSNKVSSDYFTISVIEDAILKDKGISNITPEMIKAIDLICQWSEVKEREFEYTAKYYWEDSAEYDIKSDELGNEAESIAHEYHDLMNSMYLSVNPE